LAYYVPGQSLTGSGATIFTTQCNAVVWIGNCWIAGGSGTNTLAYSLTAQASNTIPNWVGNGASFFTTSCNALAWNGTVLVVGGSGTNTLGYSYNGTSFTATASTTIITTAVYALCNGNTQFIAGGTGTNTFTGGVLADTITGGTGVDVVVGGSGNDTISTGTGNDTVTGSAGADSITVGSGTDYVVYLDDSGESTTITALTNPITLSTTTTDLVYGMAAGDVILLGTAVDYTATDTNTTAGDAEIQTAASTSALVNNGVTLLRGSYSSGVFVSSASGADTLLVFDADELAATTSYQAVVLVGTANVSGTVAEVGTTNTFSITLG
jgi:Ca2+-binding RTX toxin-like protein